MKYTRYVRLKLLSLLFAAVSLNASAVNTDNFNGIEKMVTAYKNQGAFFTEVPLLSPAPNANVMLPTNLTGYTLYKMDEAIFDHLMQTRPITLSVNFVFNGQELKLSLVKAELMTDNFALTKASDNGVFAADPSVTGFHFHGYINGEESSSIVAISIYRDGIYGLISSARQGDIEIGKLKENSASVEKNIHIAYKSNSLPEDAKMKFMKSLECGTRTDDPTEHTMEGITPADSKCVTLFIEVDYTIYSHFGSIPGAAAYALALANQSACIYRNDGINIKVCQIHVWNHASPYIGHEAEGQLHLFQATRTSFTGNLAVMIDFRDYGGWAAGNHGLSGGCETTSERQCYVGVEPTYHDVPVYSWPVKGFTHELGHLMGSRHTHACVWNGTGTAIDGCSAAEGSCPDGPIPSTGGTIMSYCQHLTSVGINFYLGFGPQPGQLIRDKIAAATCVSSCINCPEFWILYTTPSPHNFYTAYNFIKSTTQNTDPPGLEYDAGKYILLNPNFSASSTTSSSWFLAHINGCTPNTVVYTSKPGIRSDVQQAEQILGNVIDIFPNPTQDNVTISYPCRSDGRLEIGVKDVSGRVRFTESVTCNEGKNLKHVVDIVSFAPGVYFIELTFNEQHVVKKIVKL